MVMIATFDELNINNCLTFKNDYTLECETCSQERKLNSGRCLPLNCSTDEFSQKYYEGGAENNRCARCQQTGCIECERYSNDDTKSSCTKCDSGYELSGA